MLFINKLFNSIACLLSFTNLQLVIPGRTWILLYLGRTVYKRLWACLALYLDTPVVYFPPICWGGLPHACWDPSPWVWAWRPPWPDPPTSPPQLWTWRPPWPDPSTSPLGVGLETPPGQTRQTSPWLWAWRPPPPGEQND